MGMQQPLPLDVGFVFISHEMLDPKTDSFYLQLELSPYLRQSQVNIAWCTVFLHTVAKTMPASAMAGDGYDREKHHWWKAKKWAYFNLNRLFIRYCNVCYSILLVYQSSQQKDSSR